MRLRAAVVSLLCMLLQGAQSLSAQRASSAVCGGNSTVANFDPTAVKPAEAFLAQLQTAVKANNRSAVVALVEYPLRVNGSGRPRRIRSRQSLLAQFGTVFSAKVNDAILKQQPACLFANAQGIMIGNGEIWFDKTLAGRYAILAVNSR